MPSRNELKEYLPDAIYHIYNRGVERRRIYRDGHDYRRFLDQLRNCLEREPGMTLLAYCLMPNHFHLLLHQAEPRQISRLMQRLSVGYTLYFNKKDGRIGPLLQGVYKAVRVVGPAHLMDVSRYIHRNPERSGLDWRQHEFSSRRYYLPRFPASLRGPVVDPWPVLDLFDFPGDYWDYLNYRSPRLSRAESSTEKP